LILGLAQGPDKNLDKPARAASPAYNHGSQTRLVVIFLTGEWMMARQWNAIVVFEALKNSSTHKFNQYQLTKKPKQ
jgi:hypothetical protein